MRRTSLFGRWMAGVLAVCLFTALYVPGTTKAERIGEHILFGDSVGPGVIDYSWADHSLDETGTVYAGERAIRLNPSMDGALYLYSTQYFLTSEYNTLEFWVHGGEEGGQKLNVVFQLGGQDVAKVALNHYLEAGGLKAGEWQQVRIYLPPLRIPNGLFDGILLWDASGTGQGDIYVDEMKLTMETEPVPNKPPQPVEEHIVIYDNELSEGFQVFTSETNSLRVTDVVYSAPHAIRVDPSGGEGIYFYKDRALSPDEYTTLSFMLNGGHIAGQQLELVLKAGGADVLTIDLAPYIGKDTLPPEQWVNVSIPLVLLDIPNRVFDGFVIRGRGDGPQQPIYLDDLRYIRKTYEQPKLTGISFTDEQLTMYAGNFETPIVRAYYDNGFTEVVSAEAAWSSDAPDIIKAENGKIEALAVGQANVTATYEGYSAFLPVKAIEIIAEDVYTDGLAEMWDDWSWARRSLNAQSIVHSGTAAIEMTPRWWQGVYFNREDSYEAADYYGFEFWIHGGDAGKQSIRFVVQDMNTILGSVVLDEVLPQGIKANEWQKVTVRLKDLDITEGYFNAIVFQAWDPGVQDAIYIDDVKVLRYKDRIESPKPQVTNVSVAIDTTADRRPISPDIYGVNMEEIEPEDMSEMTDYTVMRWGGNAVTRYNWELNVQNHASDWFYMNLPKENTPGQNLPHGSRSDQFIDETLANGAKVLLQVPTIGWTPKSREVTTGFSVAKYGEQQQTECSYGGWWCNPDAGNGIRPDGTLITGNDPHDTSKEIGPDFVARWIEHIQSRVGDAVNDYALDNEPMLWPYTHRDVHPGMTTYDEIWNYTIAYGGAIKEADPDANVYGPVVWGWCAYLYSAADGCSPGDDYASHGNTPFLEWYLKQVEAYRQQTGVRLIDYLDIHYYPAEAGVATSADESKAVSARRLKSLKSLYDPKFRDSSSWIWEPVNLIPRMKELIDRTAPGTKLAITEYNFGNGRGISAGLAQAEALAIFGREGVDLATRWGQPLANTPLEDAFELYLNYDGQGSRIEGDSVRAVSSNVDMVGSYAIHGEDGTLYILLFNKDTAPKQADVDTAGQALSAGDVYRFDASNQLAKVDTVTIDGTLQLELPARSATLIVAKP